MNSPRLQLGCREVRGYYCPRSNSGSMATGSMLVRLTRARRLWAVRFAVLVYALCILAPTLSFALPGSHAVSPCLTDANHTPGMVHLHADVPAAHHHADGIT